MVTEGSKNVFAWNSEAIASLQHGKYAEATSKFRSAMAALRMNTQDGRGFRLSADTGYGSQAGNEVLEDVSIVSVPVVLPNMTDLQDSESLALDTDNNLFRPFDSAFMTTYLNYEGVRGLQLTCAFVLYNLALSVHLEEVAKTSRLNCGSMMNANNLRRALKLYTRSLLVICGSPGDGRPEEVTLLMLALYNNLGNLYSYLGMVDQCRQCLGWLRHLLEQYRRLLPDPVVRPDVAFFYLNSMSLPDSVFDKAAAA